MKMQPMQMAPVIYFIGLGSMGACSLMAFFSLRGWFDYRLTKDIRLRPYLGMTFSTMLFAGGNVACTLQQKLPFSLHMTHWLWMTGFFAAYFYHRAIRDFLNVDSRFVRILLRALGTLAAIACLAWIQSMIFDQSFMMFPGKRATNEVIHGGGGDLVTLTSFANFVGLIEILILLGLSSYFLWFSLRRKRRERLLVFGISLSAGVTVNEVLMGLGLIATPSLMFLGKLFEVLRIGEYYHRQALKRVRVLEAQLEVISKQAAAAFVAGGLAHDLNNTLAILFGDVSKLKRLGQFESAERLERHLDKMRETVQSYLYLLKGSGASRSERVQLKTAVDSALELSQPRLNTHGVTDVRCEVRPDIFVWAQSVQIEMILANLIINAADAISELSEKWIRIEARSEQRYLEIRVLNPGQILPEIENRLFEIGFSSKGAEGSGVGLKISRELAKANAGSLEFEKRSHEICFCLRLPLADAV